MSDRLGWAHAAGETGYISQVYGVNPEAYAAWPSVPFHNGYDATADEGADVLALADGLVTRVAWDPSGYGVWIEVQHSGFATRYAHGIRGGYTVGIGAELRQGARLMHVGMTGNTSGFHTHGEIRTRDPVLGLSGAHYISPSGRYVIDPFPYLPSPWGEGLPIGANMLNEITRLEAEVRQWRGQYTAEHAKRMGDLGPAGDTIRHSNRMRDRYAPRNAEGEVELPDDLAADDTRLNSHWQGRA